MIKYTLIILLIILIGCIAPLSSHLNKNCNSNSCHGENAIYFSALGECDNAIRECESMKYAKVYEGIESSSNKFKQWTNFNDFKECIFKSAEICATTNPSYDSATNICDKLQKYQTITGLEDDKVDRATCYAIVYKEKLHKDEILDILDKTLGELILK